jgi:tetratricopeptide (TPR) repeat protein
MAQLAGNDVTRQAIFLIEAGRTRPSMRTLEMIASRTGRPAESFLVARGAAPANRRDLGDSRLMDLQALCLQQQFDRCVRLGIPMLSEPLPPRLEAHVRHYVGQALVRSGRPEEGLEHLRQAQAILENEPDPWLAVECADWEASALYLMEDHRALSVAEKALKLCRATEPRVPGTEARILEHIATIHVRNHSFDRAISLYEEALRAAGTMRDLPRLGRTYHGLSIAYQERGDLGLAIEYTYKALALYALEQDKALLARGENELGLLLMRQGHMARAEGAFHTALAHFEEAGIERAKSHVLLSLSELQLKTGRYEDGVATAKRAIVLAEQLDEKLALAAGHELLAQLYERRGRRQAADRHFGLALRLLKKESLPERLAECHASYAAMLEERGDRARSALHWKQAASLALQKQPAAGRLARAR